MRTFLTQLRCRNIVLDLSSPIVMGIINITPDSFFPGSRVPADSDALVEKATKMVSEGASILDIGGMSTRPGATEIPLEEELQRVLPVVEKLSSALPGTIISIDTYRAEVAEAAIKAGASMVNDISGCGDNKMINVLQTYKPAYVLMHMRGTSFSMQSMTDYQDLISDLLKYFVRKLRILNQSEVHDIVIDPGFGFAKTIEQNYSLIAHLEVFRLLGFPAMIGVSRKSTLSRTIDRPVEETLDATTALHMAALLKGVSILRVHDVRPAMDAIRVYHKLKESKKYL